MRSKRLTPTEPSVIAYCQLTKSGHYTQNPPVGALLHWAEINPAQTLLIVTETARKGSGEEYRLNNLEQGI